MSGFAYLSLIGGLIVFFLGDFVYHQDKQAQLNRVFLLLACAVATYSVSLFAFSSAGPTVATYVSMRVAGNSWILVIPLINHFVLIFTKKNGLLAKKWPLAIIYAGGFVLFVSTAADSLDVSKWAWGYAYTHGPWRHFLLLAWATVFGLLPVIICSRFAQSARGNARRSAILVTAGLALLLLFGVAEGLTSALEVHLPLSVAGMMLTVVTFTYTIRRYGLFSISPEVAADQIVAGMTDSLILLDQTGRVLLTNTATQAMLGYQAQELAKKPAAAIFADGVFAANQVARATSFGRPIKNEETTYRSKKGDPVDVLVSSSPVKDARGGTAGTVLIARDITRRKKTEAMIKHMAYHDTLTGLPNRALIRNRLDLALADAARQQARVAFLYLDLDQFKNINDEFGHEFGDKVLNRLGERLKNAVREMDTVARVGGDEFNILLTDIKRKRDAAAIARKVIDAVVKPLLLGGRHIVVSASIGLSFFPKDGRTAQDIITAADLALGHAKEHGRNRYSVFTGKISRKSRGFPNLKEELRQAAERQELVLRYRPLVGMGSGQVVGAEAVLRWRHPKHGLILPPAFMPLAEESGLALSVGEWFLLSACGQIKGWQQGGFSNLQLMVKLFGAQLEARHLARLVAGIIDKSGLGPNSLVLELTEAEIMRHFEETATLFRGLKAEGVRVAVDDFGAGHSTLLSLRRSSIDMLKVARACIQDAPDEKAAATILEAILSLARTFELPVIVEGFETEDQLGLVRSIDKEAVKGYLVDKHLSADEFQRLLMRGGNPAA